VHPFDLFVQRWQHHGGRPRVTGDQARGLCPYHRDTRPSLGVKRREHDILFNCFFCGKPGKLKILQALGLTERDLFIAPAMPRAKAPIIAEYNYCDMNGTFIAQKVRTASKDFWFRRPDPHAKDGWRNDLKSVCVGLYRIQDLIDTPVIYLTESEKSVDRLWSLGLPATCGPFGAKRWMLQWSMSLWKVGCRELVVLADNDLKGSQHSELVAGITSTLNVNEKIVLKVVHFPSLPEKADVVDFLKDHDAADLLALFAMTPLWSPHSAERDRLTRQRMLTRERVRRHRERGRRSLRSVTQARLKIRSVTDVTLHPVTRTLEDEKPLPFSQLAPVTQCERSSSTLQDVSMNDLLSDLLPSERGFRAPDAPVGPHQHGGDHQHPDLLWRDGAEREFAGGPWTDHPGPSLKTQG
jgi:hypothetical protein